MASGLTPQQIADLAKDLSDALDAHEARKSARPSLSQVLDVLQILVPKVVTPEFRERAHRFGAELRALQQKEDRAFRTMPLQKPAPAEPFDCYHAIGFEGRAAVNKLLKTQCGTRRRKRFPEGPTRRSPAQGGGHGR